MTDAGWKWRTVYHQRDSNTSGCKLGIMKATGSDIYKRMKCESGVHKVIRIPETEKQGRLHSSTISIVVLPDIEIKLEIKDSELRFDYMRSSGPGGQHVNKTESACRVTHIPTGLAVAIQQERKQEKNKEKALEVLKEKLFEMEMMNQQNQIQNDRKEQMGQSDRSDKIRTYNYPQSRITDHRTSITLYDMDKMMRGEYMDQLIDAYLEKLKKIKTDRKIKELLTNLEAEAQSQPI